MQSFGDGLKHMSGGVPPPPPRPSFTPLKYLNIVDALTVWKISKTQETMRTD